MGTRQAAKRPRKALQPSNGRFSESDYSDMAVPSNTKNNNDWVHNNFMAWWDARNKENPDNPCPDDLLYKQPFDVVALCYWIPRYACETRTRAGNKYPASTIFGLLGGLLRRMRAISDDCLNFLDTKDSEKEEEGNALWDNGVLGDDTPERLLNAVLLQWKESMFTR